VGARRLQRLGSSCRRRLYEAATAAGGQDNGPPGVREHYHPSYYVAYVYDADRNNIEAVYHTPV
jgi:hypothetical protein